MRESLPLELKKIIYWGIGQNLEEGDGAVPLNWSWEVPENTDMPPCAFLLYGEAPDYVEMRQIYVARRCLRQGIGGEMLKWFEDKHKGKKVHIYVRFTDHDPDNIFHDFLVSQGYKADEENPDNLWVKQL